MRTGAYDEYVAILSSLKDEHIRIYTDGGHSPDSKSTCFGIRIVKHKTEENMFSSGSQMDSGARLSVRRSVSMAIYKALRWLQHEYKDIFLPIHIFTDSKYAFNACTSVSFRA